MYHTVRLKYGCVIRSYSRHKDLLKHGREVIFKINVSIATANYYRARRYINGFTSICGFLSDFIIYIKEHVSR